MASYTHEYSSFPDQILTRHQFRDADDSIANVINQIKILQSQGEYARAAEYISVHKAELGPYVLGSEYLNTIDEETRNVEIYAKAKKQQIFYQGAEPDNSSVVGDVWLGEYEV